jgi:tryptophanyl-tRNA synthetase
VCELCIPRAVHEGWIREGAGSEIKNDPEGKPAISNLLRIYSAINDTPIRKLEDEFSGKGYGQFKAALAETVINAFSDFRNSKEKFIAKKSSLKKTLEKGSSAAGKIASKKISEVRQKTGIRI